MLREIAEEITDSIDLLNKHATVISRFTEAINLKVNGSPYKKNTNSEKEYRSLKVKLVEFLDENREKPEESEVNNEQDKF